MSVSDQGRERRCGRPSEGERVVRGAHRGLRRSSGSEDDARNDGVGVLIRQPNRLHPTPSSRYRAFLAAGPRNKEPRRSRRLGERPGRRLLKPVSMQKLHEPRSALARLIRCRRARSAREAKAPVLSSARQTSARWSKATAPRSCRCPGWDGPPGQLGSRCVREYDWWGASLMIPCIVLWYGEGAFTGPRPQLRQRDSLVAPGDRQ